MASLWPGPHVELLQEQPTLQKNVSQDLRVTVLVDGVATGEDASAVTLTVTDASDATVTTGAVSLITTGEMAALVAGPSIPTETALSTTWTVTYDFVASTFVFEYDVVGNHLFTLNELRNSGASKFTAAKFPDVMVLRAREVVTDFFEYYCNTSFRRKYREITLDGNGRTELLVPVNNLQEVLRWSIDSTAATAGQLSDTVVYEHGKLYYPGGWGSGYKNVTVGYIEGPTRPPRDVADAAIEYTKWALSPGNTTDRAMILTDETGTYRLSQAGRDDKPTGFPSIDFVLNLHRELGIW